MNGNSQIILSYNGNQMKFCYCTLFAIEIFKLYTFYPDTFHTQNCLPSWLYPAGGRLCLPIRQPGCILPSITFITFPRLSHSESTSSTPNIVV